jgi:hypothetical protein
MLEGGAGGLGVGPLFGGEFLIQNPVQIFPQVSVIIQHELSMILFIVHLRLGVVTLLSLLIPSKFLSANSATQP